MRKTKYTKDYIYSIISEATTVYKTIPNVERHKIVNSKQCRDIFKVLIGDSMEFQEILYIMLLNTAGEIIAVQKMSEGGQRGTIVDVKRIIKSSCDLLATGIIMCHNHPSNNMKPSNDDIASTKKLKAALDLVDIKLLDNIIVGCGDNYYSFGDEGLI